VCISFIAVWVEISERMPRESDRTTKGSKVGPKSERTSLEIRKWYGVQHSAETYQPTKSGVVQLMIEASALQDVRRFQSFYSEVFIKIDSGGPLADALVGYCYFNLITLTAQPTLWPALAAGIGKP
jgi:hypothetical protein